MMPRPFIQLSRPEFLDLLNRFPFKREINAVHMHHTWIPRRSQYRGLGTIEAMERDHRENRGFSDIAQHITIAPDGTIWTGRSWDAPPASAVGNNGNRDRGPFMFEIIGDFDTNQEVLGGDQKETVLTVIASIQKKFSLPPESLRFHNQMSKKSCPGSSISYAQFLEDVREKHRTLDETAQAGRAARAEGAPFGAEHAERATSTPPVQNALDVLTRVVSRGLEEEGELDETGMTAERRSFLSGADGYTERLPAGADRGLLGPSRLTADEKAHLRPHVVDLREGLLIKGGDFFTLEGDVRAIFTEHLEREAQKKAQAGQKLRVLFFAHGGLVSEVSGLHGALDNVDWWMKNSIYPIYFIWETGLLQTIGQLLRGGQARGVFDTAVDFWDGQVEKAARRLGGERIWSGMKRNAERASAPGGGAALVADLLKAFCTKHPNTELHAVGHSAGAIFHAHFLPEVFRRGVPAFESLQLMAPAVRVDTFRDQLIPEIAKKNIKSLTMFTMKTDFELADNCAGIYRKSLLYLIRKALEPDQEAELLGLEESLRRDGDLVKLFGLEGNPKGNAEIVFSKTLAPSGRSASRSVGHGDFDNDPPTMNSIALRVLGLPDNGVIELFPESKGRALEDPWAPPDLSDLFPSAQMSFSGSAATTSSSPFVSAPSSPASTVAAGGSGERRALCVGINAYDLKPLSGCVADARLWESTLQGLGFTTTRLLDEEATGERLRSELRHLVTTSRPGDVVVFQYSGHGTQVPDLDGDEVSGPDEALCPVDFFKGALLVDDDISDILAELPAGVSFTFFMDNCFSGDISRFAVGRGARAAGSNANSRFLPLPPEAEQAYVSSRKARGQNRALARGVSRPLRGVLFGACKEDEVAWEVNGQGEFTIRATRLLRESAGKTNRAFQQSVLQAFGSDRRQTPVLVAAEELLDRPLLAPLDGAGADRGLEAGKAAAMADEFQRFADRLRGFHG
jgi:hypothetical protein